MPSRKSARITVSNDSDRRCNAFYYYLDWQKRKSLLSAGYVIGFDTLLFRVPICSRPASEDLRKLQTKQ